MGFKRQQKKMASVKHEPATNLRADGVTLSSPVTALHGVGAEYAKLLAKLNIRSCNDFLFHFPRKYLDRHTITPVSEVMLGDSVNIVADVVKLRTVRTTRGRYQLTTAELRDKSGSINAIWFNQPYREKQLRNKRNVAFFGRIRRGRDGLQLQSPEFEFDLSKSFHAGRIVPVYRSTGRLSQKWLRIWIGQVVNNFAGLIPEHLPDKVLTNAKLVEIDRALKMIHFPESDRELGEAVQRLGFDELFLLQLGVLTRRREWRESVPGLPVMVKRDEIRSFVRALEFRLTGAQKAVVAEILNDLGDSMAMNRLLQGDVGSGKTVVAACAALAVASAGFQVAIMVPTQLLAEQHFNTLSQLFQGYDVRLEMITGALTSAKRRQAWERVSAGEVQVVVGTHALISKEASFDSLNLVVVDEQHRFGVQQRARLRGNGYNPHMLVMTATPIPRTMTLTMYGDLDVSRLTDMPEGRQPVKTGLVSSDKRSKAYAFVCDQVNQGRQAFIIFPVIEESDTQQVRAAEDEFARLQRDEFSAFAMNMGLLHGRLSSTQKSEVMKSFRDGEIKILVSTSVVEVGVDVPNATVMMIEESERFGLAQLHQFRGRVGRGSYQSYCLLMSDSEDASDNERLLAMTKISDGFELAEQDLVIRGPGEILGQKQSGIPELRVASLTDVDTLVLARRQAIALFKFDPDLCLPENERIKTRLRDFWHKLSELS